METVIEILQNTGLAVLVANIITMFVDDTKVSKAGPVTKAVIGFLNTVSLNLFKNENKKEVEKSE